MEFVIVAVWNLIRAARRRMGRPQPLDGSLDRRFLGVSAWNQEQYSQFSVLGPLRVP